MLDVDTEGTNSPATVRTLKEIPWSLSLPATALALTQLLEALPAQLAPCPVPVPVVTSHLPLSVGPSVLLGHCPVSRRSLVPGERVGEQ